ncbi:thiol-activated cytolysin family protein [Chitinophaga nivalis]|uniref:Thiol-activated cytolysin family protein n=1 Tax=Chitinophaga nivalis TaxID=2991709 RepID=A0ABT3IMA1_9BACT|nr:thiol-activated cytolysin family protein [Chitinophaga nivalis]MCW3465277.1 thiol-activated cytolysin family protein [Chitinophaga nivalis]MCW3485031.1 thiol-activated cytolysin family protein [Chitinophaga nivalis]
MVKDGALQSDGKFPETFIHLKVDGHIPAIATEKTGLGNAFRPDKQAGGAEIIKDSLWQDEFGKTLYAETSEMTMLQNTSMNRLIFAGALLQGNSLADLNIKPIAEFQSKVKPITVSLSIPAKKVSGVITSPSLSATRTFVNDILSQNNIGEQISSYSFSMDQFTAYDELKLAFGSNVKTGALFFKQENTSTSSQLKISRRSGIYVRFVQKNFTLDLDQPTDGKLMDNSTDMNALNQQFPVYVSSITYGRMGIMAIESDSSYESTYAAYNTAFKALFVSGSSSLTTEQKQIIDHSDMRIYLVGTDGDGSVQTINGFNEFVKLATQGTKFSASQPGVPIYCSLSHVSDNSTVKTKFKIDVALQPVYARIEYDNAQSKSESFDNPGSTTFSSGYRSYTTAAVNIRFYSDPLATRPTFPPANVRFFYTTYTIRNGYSDQGYSPYVTWDNERYGGAIAFKQNAFLASQINLSPFTYLYNSDRSSGQEDFGAGGTYRFSSDVTDLTYFELKPGSFYKILTSPRP